NLPRSAPNRHSACMPRGVAPARALRSGPEVGRAERHHTRQVGEQLPDELGKRVREKQNAPREQGPKTPEPPAHQDEPERAGPLLERPVPTLDPSRRRLVPDPLGERLLPLLSALVVPVARFELVRSGGTLPEGGEEDPEAVRAPGERRADERELG